MPLSKPPPRVQVQGQRGLLSPPQSPAVRQDKPPAQQQEESSEGPQVLPLSPLKVEQIKSAISAINKEASNFEVSTSGKSKEDSTKLVPDVIDITGDKLDKLKTYEYTDSKEETIKQSPYKESVILCETGKPDYQYLTDTEMNDWGKEENKTKIYSDHAPVLYKVNNSTDKKCSTTQSGGEGMGQVGGAGPAEIDFVTWNIGMQGQLYPSSSSPSSSYTHKFKGKVVESDDIYKQRLKNNANAIDTILKQGYNYVLLQEGPTTAKTSNLFKSQIESKNLHIIQPSYTPASGDTSTSDSISEFCFITTDDLADYTSSGMITFPHPNKNVEYIGEIAETIYNTIARGNGDKKIGKINLDGYSTLKKDFLRIWFFINEKKKFNTCFCSFWIR
jgi:hypothetical protein